MAFIIWLFLNAWAIIYLLKRTGHYVGNAQLTLRLLIANGLGIPAALVFVYYALLYPTAESVTAGGNVVATWIGGGLIFCLAVWLVYHFWRTKTSRSLAWIVVGCTVIDSFIWLLFAKLITLL
ncbi:hypothetical protein [Deinococcus sp.]|uniref:hypothetical protein n=1 Tax=Deinococcus sp. TaxID=47478 RepID=UPI003C7E7921